MEIRVEDMLSEAVVGGGQNGEGVIGKEMGSVETRKAKNEEERKTTCRYFIFVSFHLIVSLT